MISYGNLARSGSRAQFKRYIIREVVAPKPSRNGERGYSDQSNAYKGLVKHCLDNDLRTSFFKVVKIEERWFFVER